MTHLDDELERRLKFDGLKNAEERTGRSYKEDKATEALGFMAHLDNAEATRQLLEERDDTVFLNDLGRYLRICEELGFVVVYQEPFVGIYDWSSQDGSPIHHDQRQETFYILWRDDGLVLDFDTYSFLDGSERHVNGARLHYEWLPAPGLDVKDYSSALSSRTWDDVWVNGEVRHVLSGSHDAREALRYKIFRLERYGSFLNPWPAKPVLAYLCHYQDAHDIENIGMVTSEMTIDEREAAVRARAWEWHRRSLQRLEALPDQVQKCIRLWLVELAQPLTW